MTTENLPERLAPVTSQDTQRAGLPDNMRMAPGLAIFFNDAMYQRCKQIASIIANSGVARHLVGKPEACFAVISRAITWNLDPMAVAMATYQTPGGSIGYFGALVQAILENSGRLEGGVAFEHKGDWTKVANKFKKDTSQRGKEFVVPTWTEKDAEGLYVIVRAKIKGEAEPRELAVYLNEAFPLNSPLWATSPRVQICYLAVRRFANVAMPSVLMGLPFDVDPGGFYEGGNTIELTPAPARPRESEFAPRAAEEPNKATTVDLPDAQVVAESEREVTREDISQESVQQAEDDNQDQASNKDDAEETAFQRGTRLLESLTAVRDIGSLRDSIADEMGEEHADAAKWQDICDERRNAIVATNAAQKAKATGKK